MAEKARKRLGRHTNHVGQLLQVDIMHIMLGHIILNLADTVVLIAFFCDEYHTWYYNGRQIRMGEIPPLPPSMQTKLPETGKEIRVSFVPTKEDQTIYIATNLPDGCKIYIGDNTIDYTKEYIVSGGCITIEMTADIDSISIRDSGVFTSDEDTKKLLGEKNRNLTGDHIKYHPLYGNIINFSFDFQ